MPIKTIGGAGMPKASDKRRECPYCGVRRGMKVGTDMCVQCFNLFELVRDQKMALIRIMEKKFQITVNLPKQEESDEL